MIKENRKLLYSAISDCLQHNNEEVINKFINRHREYLMSEEFLFETEYKKKIYKCVIQDKKEGHFVYHIWKEDDAIEYTLEATYFSQIVEKELFSCTFHRRYICDYERFTALGENENMYLIERMGDGDIMKEMIYKHQCFDISNFQTLKERIKEIEAKKSELDNLMRNVIIFN